MNVALIVVTMWGRARDDAAPQAEEVISEFSGAFALPTKYEGFVQVTALTADATQVRNELKRLRELAPSTKPAKKK
jgi:hypothetical protein